MRNQTIALIGGALLILAVALGAATTALAEDPNGTTGWRPGTMMGGHGPGMMGSHGSMMGTGTAMGSHGAIVGTGMMEGCDQGGALGGYGQEPTGTATPIGSLAEAQNAFQSYLDRVGNSDLALVEVMEFEQNYYAIVKETSTGQGAFELLANKQTGVVFPEHGPNMMWNTKYGHMVVGHGGMMGGQWGTAPADQTSVTPERAREIAQQWLNVNQPGSGTESPDIFPGYYTLHTTKDGKITGMLSVNAVTGQVWYHSWHGAFIATTEVGH
jgi:hypothetical protein